MMGAQTGPSRRKGTSGMRKVPRQVRAQRTVSFILDAAAYILAKHGLAGFTTNRVAERAGVNIASLYQYFPNKAAILDALQARHAARPDQPDALPMRQRLAHLPLAEMLREMVEGALAEHADNLEMHRVLLTTLPRSARDARAPDRPAQLAALLGPKIRSAAEPGMRLFIARHALLGVIDEAVCARPEWVTNSAFAEELIRLLTGYLVPQHLERRHI
jgi:AcrR family transcriptional regulator